LNNHAYQKLSNAWHVSKGSQLHKASDGEESLKIESFEERIARYDVETPVQQWYGDARFSGFGFDYGGMVGASSSHPPPFDSPPPAHTHDDEGENKGEQDENDE
jgi:hypothetical protein